MSKPQKTMNFLIKFLAIFLLGIGVKRYKILLRISTRDMFHLCIYGEWGVQWHSGRASDIELRGPGLDPTLQPRFVFLNKAQ